ncbi:MAG: DUF3794 domain-containing protein [Clostridia bacterium]|nr:DUF3794 domain-containing protein [Clostridia bacterium]
MMQIDFQKENLHVSELAANQAASLLVEGDVIVPDIKPDVKEVLLTEATAVVTNHSFAEGKLSFSGVTAVKILYIPEGDSDGAKSIDAKFEFKDVIELAKEDMADVNVKAQVEHAEFSLINSRKLNMKVVVAVSAKCYRRKEVVLLSDAAKDCPLKVRTRALSSYQVIADTSRELVVSETLEIPAAKPDADEIIKLSAKAFRGECKIMSGKMILKGALVVHTLYQSLDPEDGIHTMEHELPFGEMVEVEGLDDACLCNVSYEIKDVYYVLKDDLNGDPRVISLDVVLRADILASKIQDAQCIEDCYSVSGRAEVARDKMQLDELLCEGISHLSLKEILTVPEGVPAASAVYSLDCKPKVQELLVADEKLIIRGKLTTFVLYGSAEGEAPLYSLMGEFNFEHSVPAEGADETAFCECGVTDQNISFTLNAASEIELRCVLEFYTRAVRKQEIEHITGCELMEDESGQTESRGLVIYFAQKGDTLWDVAKHYRIDQDTIMQLNQMDNGQILAGQKILIPGR